ncbi:MAG: hydantoinase B/oxoprolinase family protein [Proteobacteria bacterium]|nr:hydantoinase B/oxoprolinase family protein [Pseudomonadota bacterium]
MREPGGARRRAAAKQAIELQTMWNRLIAVVEEQAQALVRTGFSTSTREAGDVSAGVFEPGSGRMFAQAVTGTPGHVNSMAEAVKHFLRRFPPASMRPGDAFITNDPWLATGHLHDFTVVTPAFRGRRPIALFAATCHVVDIGGLGLTPDGRQIFHEGLQVPILRLAERGRVDPWFLALVRANVREPTQVVGDIHSLLACNEVGIGRLSGMMAEFGIASLEPLAAHILSTSRAAKLAAIRKIPPGTYENEMRIDGFDRPLTLRCALGVSADGIVVDYAGSPPQNPYAINVPLSYATANSCFAVNCVIAPRIPNNAGSLELVTVRAPAGSLLNPKRPAAVASRGIIGQMLPDVVLGCLAKALPEMVPAESTSCLWNLTVAGGPGRSAGSFAGAPASAPFDANCFHNGGTGARPSLDGLSATAFPSGVRNVPVEITETVTPLVVWRKEFRPDSGGAGRFRGGLGQVMHIAHRAGAPFTLFARYDRIGHPPRGRAGGGSGAPGRVGLLSGAALKAKGAQAIPPGATLVLEMPGGGGHGEAGMRDPARVAEDVRNGLVSPGSARTLYRVALCPDGGVDEAGTARLRA